MECMHNKRFHSRPGYQAATYKFFWCANDLVVYQSIASSRPAGEAQRWVS